MVGRRSVGLVIVTAGLLSLTAAMLVSNPSRPAERTGPLDQADRRFPACHSDPRNVTAAFAVDHVDDILTVFPAWIGGSPDLRGAEPGFVVVFASTAPPGPWGLTSACAPADERRGFDEGPTDPPIRGVYRDLCVVMGREDTPDPVPLLFQRVDVSGMRPPDGPVSPAGS